MDSARFYNGTPDGLSEKLQKQARNSIGGLSMYVQHSPEKDFVPWE